MDRRIPWRYPGFLFGVVLCLYTVLSVPTVGRQGISWDEQNDLWVAQAYLKTPNGWLAGSEVDPSQTRLPMAVVSLVYELLGVADLVTARLVSCLVGGLTLLGVYLFCRLEYEALTGILACLLLATSPFFLSFARVAFTETDIYLACAFAWLLVCGAKFRLRPTLGWAGLLGVGLGMALSAKFTAVVILPAVWYVIWQGKPAGLSKQLPRVSDSALSFWSVWLLICLLGGIIAVDQALSQGRFHPSLVIVYGLVCSGWGVCLAWLCLRRALFASRLSLVFLITGLALLTFLVVPPEHLTNPAIFQSLWWRAEHELAFNPAFMGEAAGLHIGSLIFKSGPLIGAGLLFSLIVTFLQWKRQPEARFPMLLVFFYSAGLMLLPLAQTFYSVPLLPILAILAAHQFLRLFHDRRALALGLASLAAILWGVDLGLCYPDYNLNGYQWLGKSVLAGRPSIGYRSIVQTPSDGVEQVIRWLNEHAQPGERVRSYLLEWHIVQAVAPRPVYRIEDGFSARHPNSEYLGVAIQRWFVDNTPFAPPLPNPDYVVVEINTQVRQSWWMDGSDGNVFMPPYNVNWLETNYTQVFVVRRAFGIEMASVWEKK